MSRSWTEASIDSLATSAGVAPRPGDTGFAETVELDGVSDGAADFTRRHRAISVVVPDGTRLLPAQLVDSILAAVGPACRARIVGLGMHRPPTTDEWQSVRHLSELRAASAGELCIRGGQEDTVAVPSPESSARWALLRHLLEVDGVIVVGVVEPHQYAGFSGGVKGISIGCAAPETVAWMHRPALLRHPGVCVGNISGNPFRRQLLDLAAHLPPVLEVQVTRDSSGGLRVFVGKDGWRDAVDSCGALRPVPRRYGAAIVGMLGSKGKNLYQASRGVTQLCLQRHPPLVEDARIALITYGQEGFGQGSGERACETLLEQGAQALLDRLATAEDSEVAGGGTQRAFVLALASRRYEIGYVALHPHLGLDSLGWQFLQTPEDLHAFVGEKPLVVPSPMKDLPFYQPVRARDLPTD